jgi:hypothetical protein
MCTCNELK